MKRSVAVVEGQRVGVVRSASGRVKYRHNGRIYSNVASMYSQIQLSAQKRQSASHLQQSAPRVHMSVYGGQYSK